MNFPRTFKPLTLVIGLTGLTGLSMVSGCSQQLTVDPGLNGESAYCIELTRSLPVEIAGELIRSTSASDSGVTAWGDPAIVLRCGVARPETLLPTSQLIAVNGVDWLPEKLTNGQRFTSVNTLEHVEVNIPSDYESASGILVDLADAFPTS